MPVDLRTAVLNDPGTAVSFSPSGRRANGVSLARAIVISGRNVGAAPFSDSAHEIVDPPLGGSNSTADEDMARLDSTVAA